MLRLLRLPRFQPKVGRDVPRQGGGGRTWWKEGAEGKDEIKYFNVSDFP